MDEHRAVELAARQHALITYGQARRLGLSARQIEHQLVRRFLASVHEGVYRFTSAAPSRNQRMLAACLAVGRPSAASHRSAATVHGIWSVSDDMVEITVGRDRSPDLVGVTVHRIADLSDRWIVEVDGVPVTTSARTLVDLGAVLPLGSVGRALDRAIGRKLVTLVEVRAALDAVARKGRAGVGTIRGLLDERGGLVQATSVLEARMAVLLRIHGVPMPVREHTVLDEHGQFVGRVDFAYPELRYAIEVDG